MVEKSFLALVISVLSVSIAAILIVSCSAPALVISLYRMVFTTLLIFFIMVIKRSYYEELIQLSSKQILLMSIIGIILAVHFTFWITSLKFTSVASSVILVTAHPIIVGPISHMVLKERLSLFNMVGILISFMGVIILVLGNYGFSSSIDTFSGNVLALLGGIAAGLYILGGRKMRKNISVIPYVFVVYSVATVVLLVFCLGTQTSIVDVSIQDLGIIFLMAVIAGIFGHTLYNWSLEKVKASVASVVLLGEPIGSAFFAFVIPWIHQVPSYWTIIGGIIILTGVYLTSKKGNTGYLR